MTPQLPSMRTRNSILTILWFLVLASCRAAPGTSVSPISEALEAPKVLESPEVRITQCPRGSQPWHVSLFKDLSFRCAGVLVDRSWVLTAAHCAESWLWAKVGDYNLLLLDRGEQLKVSSLMIPHPKYKAGSGPSLPSRSDEHDLLLMKLRRPVVLGPRVQVLPLARTCAAPGTRCQAAGWGTTSQPQVKYTKSLSCAGVTVLSPKECSVFYPAVLTSNMLCAGLDNGQDACQSDSGGPLVCNGTLQGILSWGDYPCGSSHRPAVYTWICKYIPWIEKTIRTH
ncbi:kallikrein-10 [Sarcophilus harrisii]|uniref:Kallikrein related peptidase 10 n=1 Tax=Sarcophilus harrisii TaxID=9305 RepID=G3VPH9_SARHA|nr:kallikrein-10 [Sarcophilus harrisii]